jgi:hypothetical protein
MQYTPVSSQHHTFLRLLRRVSHVLRIKHTATSIHTPLSSSPSRYSSILDSQDRLVIAHPTPTTTDTSCPLSIQSRTQPHSKKGRSARSVSAPSPRPFTACVQCNCRLEVYEFPVGLPTARCRHENKTCLYCLHNMIYDAVRMGAGWSDIKCPCGEKLRESEAKKLVVIWEMEQQEREG